MLQSTKWYGLVAKSPQEYFDKKCHTYADVEALIDNKGDKILKDIKPCFENFISNNENHEFIPDTLVDKLILMDNPIAHELVTEAINYAISNLPKYAKSARNDMWYLWTNIPALETSYRTSDISTETGDVLHYTLGLYANKIVSNLTTMDTDAIESAVDEFVDNVTYTDILDWSTNRESVMRSSPMSAHIGDLITEMTHEDIEEITKESEPSHLTQSIQEAATTLWYANPSYATGKESFEAIVSDIWSNLVDANEETFATEVERLYYSRRMSISKESYINAIQNLISNGVLPALEGVDTSEVLKYLNREDSTVKINDIKYNEELWQRQSGMNYMFATECSSNNNSYARIATNCGVIKATTADELRAAIESANANPEKLFIIEGVSSIPLDVNYFKDKPLILNGNVKRESFLSNMGLTVLESAHMFNTYVIDNLGKIIDVDSEMRALESYSSIYIPAFESENEEKVRGNKIESRKFENKVNSDKLKRNIKNSAFKAKTNVSKAFFKYKNAEEDIDDKLTHLIKKCSDEVLTGRDEARRKIVEGNSVSVVSALKLIFAGAAIFSVSKVAFFLVLITRWCNSGKIQRAERRKIIAELEGELKILDQKIAYAQSDGDRDAVYALMRTRNNVENAIKNIKRRQEADSSGGVSKVLSGRHGR